MTNPTIELDDRGDHLGGTWKSIYGDVDISVDKRAMNDATRALLAVVATDIDSFIAASLAYFESVKQNYSVDYIADLSDPNIIFSPNGFSIYWSSSAGEINGDAIIAIDFDGPTRNPISLTIGD
jgi:hypothetical protein